MQFKSLAVFVAAAALAGNAQSDDFDKFQDVVDGWSTGTWQEVSIVRRNENGAWEFRETEDYSVTKLSDYSIMIPPAPNDEPAFSVEFSDSMMTTTFFDADGKAVSTSTGEIIRADIIDPRDWAFTVKWEGDENSMLISEGILTGDTYTWSLFRTRLDDSTRELLRRGIHIREAVSE
ncbi:MAG: hypothetical protein AAGJ84_09550 [Pseudomonadota bacterium]